jgi:ABC-2 type transport system ATP-binding protein
LIQLCFIKESHKYPQTYCVMDVLNQAAWFFSRWDRDYTFALTDDFHPPLNRQMKALFRGMLSAVGVILGLASRAPLTIFDDP